MTTNTPLDRVRRYLDEKRHRPWLSDDSQPIDVVFAEGGYAYLTFSDLRALVDAAENATEQKEKTNEQD